MSCRRAIHQAVVMLLLAGCLWAQQPAAASETSEQLKALLAELQATRAEMANYRAEVQDLRKQVDDLRTRIPAPQPAASTPLPDTLAQKVAAVEDKQQLDEQKIADQYQAKVESGSRYRVKLTGTLLFNLSGNAGQVEDIDVPKLAVPLGIPAGSALALNSPGSFAATVRQSQIGLQLSGPDIWGARSSADLYFDFFGGFTPTADGATLGIARLTVARGRLDWANTSLVFGQDAPFISPLSPSSLASVSTPAFGYSGNLWTWTPQVRLEHRWALSSNWKYELAGGIMDPLSGEYPPDEFNRPPDAGERSRAPAFALHNSFRRSLFGRTLSVGLGGYYARQDYSLGRNVDAWAVTADWNLPLTRRLDWSGEAYRGRALGGLWGAVGTSVVSSGTLVDPASRVAGLNDVGGWTQLKFRATPRLEFNAAIGQDNPYARDFNLFGPPLPYAFVSRNQTAMFNFIQHLRSNLLFSIEYRHLNTAWTSASGRTADHVNAAFGVTF